MRFLTTILFAALLAAGFASTQHETAQAQAQSGAKFLKSFRDWSAYSYTGDKKTICFAVSQPKDIQPKNIDRGDVYFYVSTWPKDSVRQEISVKAGYSFQKGGTTTATIGSNVFELFTDEDKAFVESPEQEVQLVSAMRRGSKMTIRGRSARGTETTDVYSLSGITAALKFVSLNCR